MQTIYYARGDGSVSVMEIRGDYGEVLPPEGAVVLSAVKFEAARDVIEAAQAERAALEAASDRAATAADFAALTAAGIPEATARRLPGHQDDEPLPEGPAPASVPASGRPPGQRRKPS